MKYILLTVLFQAAYAKCPNGCSGHGDCNKLDQCQCFNEEDDGIQYLASDEGNGGQCFKAGEAGCAAASTTGYTCVYDAKDAVPQCKREVKQNVVASNVKRNAEWTGADCSRRTCPRSTSWTQYGEFEPELDGSGNPTGNSLTYRCKHQTEVECSDQGLCDRATGLCECFPGFTGNACQRTACPDDCSGHGTCRSNKDFAYDFAVAKTHQLLQTTDSTEHFHANYKATYDNAWDSSHLYGCLCDRGYRGANCALIECPSSNDPLDDKCSVSEEASDVENFQVQKFAATGSAGWVTAYAESTSTGQTETDPCNTADNIADNSGVKCLAVTSKFGEKCAFTASVAADPSANPPVLAQPTKCVMPTPFKFVAGGDKNNHFYQGKVYACFGAMAGMDCSGRGICDYSTGQCACFSGYSGTSCSDIEELV